MSIGPDGVWVSILHIARRWEDHSQAHGSFYRFVDRVCVYREAQGSKDGKVMSERKGFSGPGHVGEVRILQKALE